MTRRRLAGAAAALALAAASGCFSVPPYEPDMSVTYKDGSAGATVRGPGFALRFAADGVHLPDALTIDDGVDILGRDPAAACFDPSGVGLQIFPTPRISADGAAAQLTNQLDAVLQGPAAVQMTLAWATRVTCASGRELAPAGSSTFTVFPDGRIVRHDALDEPPADGASATDCQCGAIPPTQGGFTVASYWTLARTAFRAFYRTASTEQALPPPQDESNTNLMTACFDAGAFQVASAWGASDPTGTPVIEGTEPLLVVGRQKVIGASTLDPLAWDASSALFIDHTGGFSPCTNALTRAGEYAQPPTLTINGAPATMAAHDGIYGGDTGGSGPPGLPIASGRATIQGAVKSSFAVRLRFSSAVDALAATRAGATGAWWVPQQVDDHDWIVWFRDPLSDGQTIEIEAR